MIELIIAALASYRVARMVAYERGAADCFRVLRDFIEATTKEDGWLRYGVTCPLCIGVWASVLFVVAPSWFDWVTLSFAVAGLQTLLQKFDWAVKRYNQISDLNIAVWQQGNKDLTTDL